LDPGLSGIAVVAQSPGRHLPGLFLWLSVVVFLVIVVIVVAVMFKKYFGAGESTSEAPFTLADLKRMLAEGQVTQEEYERMKSGILARYHASDPRSDPRTAPRSDAGSALRPDPRVGSGEDEAGRRE
jgi:hypothetical protein